MLRATAVSALCLALAGEASAFAPSTPLPLSTASVRAARAPGIVCAAEGASAGRRELLQRAAVLSGSVLINGPAAFAADDDDDAADGPASVPREVTYQVKDDVCEKHPTWKQCKKKAAGSGGVAAGGKSSAPEIKFDNGLLVQDIVPGKGNTPQQGDSCTVHYSLYYKGAEIESSRESSGLAASPIGFQYGVTEGVGSVIPAIALGVENMKVGGIRRITAPPELAFGNKGRQGGRVPPGATVQFDVQLLSVKRRGTNPVSSQGRGSEKNTGLFDLF